MNLLQRLRFVISGKYDTLDYWKEVYGSRVSKSGATVNWKTALQVATVLACARVIAEGIAQVPFKLMKEDKLDKLPATEHPLYFLLHRKPNSWQTSYEFRETIGIHLALFWNAYVFVGRVGISRKILELVALEPDKVTVKKLDGDKLVYEYQAEPGRVITFAQDKIWHIKGPSWNSYAGMNPVSLAQEAIGLALSTESGHAVMHKNGVRTAGVYSVDGTLSAAKYDQLMKFLKERSQGGEAEGLPLLLDQGAKWLQMSMTGVDAQHLETRKHQIEEICTAFRVFPIMIGHADKAWVGSSTEQMFIAHVVHCLMPWYTRIEQSAEVNLLTEEELKSGLYIKFMPQALMRGSAKDRSDFYKSAIGSVNATPGWMTINEIRKLEELPPDPEGDKLFIPTSTPATAPKEEPQDNPQEEKP